MHIDSVTRVAIVAIAAAAMSATSATTAAAAGPVAPPAVPDGFQRIVDGTGTIAVSVPATWTNISTEPNVAPDRTVNPIISASPPWNDAFPYLTVWVEPLRADASAYAIDWCTRTVEPYAQGKLVGDRSRFTECDGGLRYQEVVANSDDGVFTVRVSIAYETSADESTFDAILASLELLATEYPPPSATAPVGCFVRCHEDVDSGTSGEVSLPPAVVDPRSPIWPYGPFWNVPQLGSEPVRGSGCGSQGQIGDVIPDGLWAGYVTNETTPAVDIDLLCIFTGAAAEHVVNEGTATIVNDEPDYLIVNNSTRTRSMPAAPWIALFDSVVSDGECVGGVVGPHKPDPPRQAWVRIDGGQVTWILWGCGDESPAGAVAAQQANLPPAYPDDSAGVDSDRRRSRHLDLLRVLNRS